MTIRSFRTPGGAAPTGGAASSAAVGPPDRRRALRRLGLFLVVTIAAVLLAWKLGLFDLRDREALLSAVDRVRRAPFLVPAFVVAYAAAVTFGLPASPFTLAGGVLFGFWQGFLLNWLGAAAGALLAYLFAGALCQAACRELLGKRASTMERMASEHGFLATLRLRLVPVVPFSLLNFAAALAGVRRRDYVLATLLGIVPGTAVYTYFADSLLGGAAGAERHAFVRLAIAAGLLLLLSFVPTLVSRARRH